MRTCRQCKESKPLSEFHHDRNDSERRRTNCRECQNKSSRDWHREHRVRRRPKLREGWLKWKYGISQADFLRFKAAQHDKCAICGGQEPLHVDHCHADNRVRGLLCKRCNTGIGLLDDSKDKLIAAIRYLHDTRNMEAT